ncbi:MAG TPA: hypothetical protein VF585_02735 [Chthoniobacterales bacterium]|jgi:hypothetical protein
MKWPYSRIVRNLPAAFGNPAIRKAGDHVVDSLLGNSERLAKRARYKLRNSAARAWELEKQVTTDFQTRPLAYLLAGAGLALLLALKIALTRRSRD